VQKQGLLYEKVEKVFNEEKSKTSKISRPRNDLEYQKMLNDLKDKGDDTDKA
jgi:hypothetical protein